VDAMERGDALGFGCLLCDSHASARDLLRISSPALDRLVDAAMDAGALGARLTGAGFGGCAIVFALRKDLAQVRAGLIARYYARREEFVERDHLIDSRPAAGALELLGDK
jgi:galactokinase